MNCTRTETKSQAKADAMVGQRYGWITVVESIGVDESNRHHIVIGKCDCGDIRPYYACNLRMENTVHKCPVCSGSRTSKPRPQTICWNCRRATNRHLCSWSEGIPRKDWVAEPTRIRNDSEKVESWRVVKCPAFEPDERSGR